MTGHRDLTTGPIGSHLLALAIPAAMGMIFNTLYNLTDFWFAGKLSDDALAGVSIAGSVFFLILSGSIGMQTGTTAIVATEVGKGNMASVSDWVNQATGLGLMLSAVCLVIGLLCADPLIKFLGAEPHVQPFAKSYVVIVLWGCFAFVLSGVAAGALMALGDTVSNRNALAVGLLANFILNPILIFGLNLNVSGLAIATVLIKLASVVYLYADSNPWWLYHRRFYRQLWQSECCRVFSGSAFGAIVAAACTRAQHRSHGDGWSELRC